MTSLRCWSRDALNVCIGNRPYRSIHVRSMPRRRRVVVSPRVKSIGWAAPSEQYVETAGGEFVRFEHHLPSTAVTESAKSALWLSMRKQWKRLLSATMAAVICSSCNVASPILMGILFEFLVLGTPLRQYLHVFSILCLSYTIEPILSQFYMRNMIAAGETVLAELRHEVFDRLLNEEVAFFDQHRTTEFTNFLSVELDTLRNFLFSNVTRDRGIRSICEVAGVIIVLFSLSYKLAPVLAGVILASAVSASLYKRSTKSIEDSQFQALTELVAVADQALSNIRTVRSFGGEDIELSRFNTSVQQSLEHGLLTGRAKALVDCLNRSAVHISLMVLFWYGGQLVRQGQLPYRVLVTAIGYVFSLVYATQGLVNTLVDSRKASTALTRVQKLIESTRPTPTPRKTIIVSKPPIEENVENGRPKTRQAAENGDLLLQNICFSYPLRPSVSVLHNLNLELNRGTRTALVGESGSGKSTVSSLLCRFYEPDSGQILLDGLPANQFDRKDWNASVALVSQEPILFRGTIFDNICYGRRKDATMHDVIQVAISANAHEFIQELPDKYNTIVGEKGALLSGGERQRIAIARALLKDAPIVLLDEATSSLDLRSEAKVQEALNRLMIGRTVMVIAHRISTIKSADTIAVLRNGSVIERGTHDDLISRDSYYARLIRSNRL